jgi:hypothetical protein
MKNQLSRAIAAVAVILVLCSLASVTLAQNNTVTYKLLDDQTGAAGYTLNIVVPQTLLEYYSEKNHAIYSSSDFSKFVTPYSVKPIADRLWEIYENEEDFTNAALAIVHQMTYTETAMGSYPVQTLLDAKGDCDIFSFVAASIINAGGLEVVLFHYEEKKHMNIGVHLTSPPEHARNEVYKFTYEEEPYYIAECTGGNWTTGWRVGECPENLRTAKAQILTLSNAEQIAPGQVSASFTKLENSDLLLEISPPFALENSAVTIRGSLTPNKPNENITIYLGISGQPWQVMGKATTTQDGSFEYTWKSEVPGMYGIRASWAGDRYYAGSTSHTINATILPLFLSLLVVVAIATIFVGAIAVAASKHTSQTSLEPIEPQPPGLNLHQKLILYLGAQE